MTDSQPDNTIDGGNRWDEVDHLLGHCDCLPPHDYLYLGGDNMARAYQLAINQVVSVIERYREEL